MAGNQVEGSYVAGNVIQIGSVTGDVTLVSDQTSFRLELLAPAPLPKRLPRSQRTPSYLLDAQRQIVPYRPRPALEQTLTEWRDDDEPISVRLMSGAGGAGKTRLAGWLATASHAEGWTVLLASDKTMPLPPATSNENLPDGGNLLVIADYAERWPLESLRTMVETLAARHRQAEDGHVRVLLLARPQLGFWDGVKAQLERAWVDLAEPLSMDVFITDGDELGEAFATASAAFQAALEIPVSPVPLPDGLPAIGEVSPLTLHMAALASVCATDEGVQVPGSDDLSTYLLGHERRYWQRCEPGEQAMATTVLIATLFGPAPTRDRARDWLTRARLASNDAEAERLLTAHDRCYPAPSTTPAPLTPLKPDLFAEDFLAAYVGQPQAEELLADLLIGDEAPGARHAFIVLSSSATRHSATRNALFTLLRTTRPIPSTWLNPALLGVVTDHAPDDLAVAVQAAIRFHRTDLLRPALVLSETLFRRLPTNAPLASRADRLFWLGIRLSDVGDKHAALESIHEAAELYLRLSETEPDTYLPGFAASLGNLANGLADVGERRAALAVAQEAVQIHRQLAENEPDTYLPDLAGNLANLSGHHAWVDGIGAGLKPAQEAVRIYRQLAKSEPDTYLPPRRILDKSQREPGKSKQKIRSI